MKDKKITLLLHVINTNGNIRRLTRDGISFKEITDLISQSIDLGYLSYINERIILTAKGKLYLHNEQNTLKKKSKSEWIEKDLRNKISKHDKKVLFLPDQNELSF